MNRALSEYLVTGIKTTISFQQAILQDPNFRRGVYSTTFIEQLLSGARRELIEDNETGLIFQAGSKESLMEKLDLVLSRRVDVAAMGRRARQFVIERRQWHHQAARYDDAYRAAGVRGS